MIKLPTQESLEINYNLNDASYVLVEYDHYKLNNYEAAFQRKYRRLNRKFRFIISEHSVKENNEIND